MGSFGQRLKEERERLGMTQAEFAAACGVGKTAQYTYEVNDRHPDIMYLGAAMAAGVDMGYLMTGERKAIGKLYAHGVIANKIGEELVLDALGALDLEGFEASISEEDIEAARRNDRAPILRKLIAHTPDLLALLDARPTVDVELLGRVLLEINLSNLAGALPANKRARVAALAYRLATRNGVIDHQVIEEAAALATQ